MSVAFRRESDEEHLEPKFEIPIPPGPNLVTQRGFALIEGRVGELEAKLAESGLAEEVVTALKRDLRYWQTRRSTAQVAPAASGDVARFGTRVTFRDADGEATVEIVGHDEADPAAGLIAFTAPLARALIGAGEGDAVDFGGQESALLLLSVSPGAG